MPYITVLPKWLLVFDGSNHRLTALPSVNFMLVGTSLTGPSFIVTVDVPLNVVDYHRKNGDRSDSKESNCKPYALIVMQI